MKKIILLTTVLGLIVTAGVWVERRCWWWNGSQWIEQTGLDTAYCRKWLLVDEKSGSGNSVGSIYFKDLLIINPFTKTPGYWKTHPEDWPRDYNPNDSFFRSGKTWMQVLWTVPDLGNVYYILAHQYIAAVLNRAIGCPVPPDVQTIIESATDWFRRYSPPVKSSSPAGRQAIIWAERLDIYNNTGR
jgi:hypothetical protein